MRIFCTACGNEASWLSMRALCVKCQKVRGAIARRIYDWRTGKQSLLSKLGVKR